MKKLKGPAYKSVLLEFYSVINLIYIFILNKKWTSKINIFIISKILIYDSNNIYAIKI